MEKKPFISLEYNKKAIYFYQVSKENANSTGYNSDRKAYKEVNNRFINKKIKVYRNIIDSKNVEFSAYFMEGNAFYYLTGTMPEDVFDEIIKNLCF